MKKALKVGIPAVLGIALIYFMIIGELSGQWLGARVAGILSVSLALFSIWRKFEKGHAVLWSLLVVVYAWFILWLYPARIAGDGVIFLFTILVVGLGMWEYIRERLRSKRSR
jgi:hypothetical protein